MKTSNDKLETIEQIFLDICNGDKKCYNIATNSEKGGLGIKRSEEFKQRMSLALTGKRTGEKNPMYGKPCSEERKKNISKALKGRRLSDETKEKMSKARKGKKKTEETKMRMSKAKKGIKKPPFTKQWIENIRKATEKRQRDTNGRFQKGK